MLTFFFMNRAFNLRKYGKLQLHNCWALHLDSESGIFGYF